MKIFETLGQVIDSLSKYFSRQSGPKSLHILGLIGFFIVAVSVALSIVDISVRWSALPATNDVGLGAALFSYPVGGRGLFGLLFLALFLAAGWRSLTWLVTLSGVVVLSRLLDFDGFVLDAFDSRDTLARAIPSEVGEVWPVSLLAFEILAGIVFASGAISLLVKSRPWKTFRQGLRENLAALRISEVILWVILLVQGFLAILAWVIVWIEPGYPVFMTYPVLGRIVGLVIFVVLAALSVSSRVFLLSVAIGSFAVIRLGIDALVVDLSEQADRFSLGFRENPFLNPIAEIQTLIGFLLPVLLVWIGAISIASVVRKRARNRINSWIDERRDAIYGAEDAGELGPRRVSILAVISLIAALVFPVLGLVLAYAARNDFVAAQPRKSGVDIAVAATILGWFGLGLQLLFLSTTLVATILDGPDPIELFFGFFGILFGGGVLTPLGFESFSDWFFDALREF